MPLRELPVRPNLANLKKQAKSLSVLLKKAVEWGVMIACRARSSY